jgi:hypothetical protein
MRWIRSSKYILHLGSGRFGEVRLVGSNIIAVVMVLAEKAVDMICCRAPLPAADLPEFKKELT